MAKGRRRGRRSWRDKLAQSMGRLADLPKVIQLVWQASRGWLVAWVILLVIQGILPVATVFLTRNLVDTLVDSTGQGISWANLQPLVWAAGAMVGVLLLIELLKGAGEWIRTAQSELVQDHISDLIQTQSMGIDFGCYESSIYNDQLERARDGGAQQSLALLEGLGSLLQNTITLFAMAAVLLTYGLWLPLLLIVSALPALGVALRLNKIQYRWSQRTTTDRRRAQYFDLVLTHNMTAAEIRAFELGPYFRSLYRQLRQRLRFEQLQLIRQQSLGKLGAGFIGLVVTGAALAVMGAKVLAGTLTVGDLALFYQAFNKGQSVIRSLLGTVGNLYRNSLFITNLFEFLQLQPTIVDPVTPAPAPTKLRQGIYFKKVTFRYPGTATPVLEAFDLVIPAGQVVAIVGDNGAGKSTLIKLLCRFYDPEAGTIEIDGVDIRQFAIADLRRLITILFQNPMEYYLTAGQNIAFGDLNRPTTQAEIEQAAHWSGIHEKLASLPQGYDSVLGKLFPGGTDMSGGEWQRLSLARAYLRKGQLVILDEPTSAMDPWAEAAWLDRFREMATGRTAIVVTHRFSLAVQADIVYVMQAGQIVESGSHSELLKSQGLYAQSWQAQTQKNETAPALGTPS
jgi:ATP-binding cassette subfamily B protein